MVLWNKPSAWEQTAINLRSLSPFSPFLSFLSLSLHRPISIVFVISNLIIMAWIPFWERITSTSITLCPVPFGLFCSFPPHHFLHFIEAPFDPHYHFSSPSPPPPSLVIYWLIWVLWLLIIKDCQECRVNITDDWVSDVWMLARMLKVVWPDSGS